uniref:WD repeat-containing protein 46 n=1 Tax=Myxine glutinosa TaxID=7769 RepID=UPI00358EC21A
MVAAAAAGSKRRKTEKTKAATAAFRLSGGKTSGGVKGKKKEKRLVREWIPRGEQNDPFVGASRPPEATIEKHRRGPAKSVGGVRGDGERSRLKVQEKTLETAAEQAARHTALVAYEPGFIEVDEGHESGRLKQTDITDCVDLASAAKRFDLSLPQFGPYSACYSANGRSLLLAGRGGHVAAVTWRSHKLACEFHAGGKVRATSWLHTEGWFAVAGRWLSVYDSQGIEVHCVKRVNEALHLRYLPHHFLLASVNSRSYLHYLDISVGTEVANIPMRTGRPSAMALNPQNAIVCVGAHNGVVRMWAPNCQEALVTLLCHRGPVRSVAVSSGGEYMATAGGEGKVTLWDVRSLSPLNSFVIPGGVGHLDFSQRGLLATASGRNVKVYRPLASGEFGDPYLSHYLSTAASSLHFCPFEDILGVGHSSGFSSLLVPGAGEPNFDALEVNPYQSKKQRQEWEVKALLEKIPPDLISLDSRQLIRLDTATAEQRAKESGKVEEVSTKIELRRRARGRDSTSSRQRRKGLIRVARQRVEIKKSVTAASKRLGLGAKTQMGDGSAGAKRLGVVGKVGKPIGDLQKRSALDRFAS